MQATAIVFVLPRPLDQLADQRALPTPALPVTAITRGEPAGVSPGRRRAGSLPRKWSLSTAGSARGGRALEAVQQRLAHGPPPRALEEGDDLFEVLARRRATPMSSSLGMSLGNDAADETWTWPSPASLRRARSAASVAGAGEMLRSSQSASSSAYTDDGLGEPEPGIDDAWRVAQARATTLMLRHGRRGRLRQNDAEGAVIR